MSTAARVQAPSANSKLEMYADFLSSVLTDLMLKYPAIYSVIAPFGVVVTDIVKTAGTDGKYIYIGTEFIDKLYDAYRRGKRAEANLALLGVLIHEALHAARLHPLRTEMLAKRYSDVADINEIANLVGDAIIDNDLKEGLFPGGHQELERILKDIGVLDKNSRLITAEFLKNFVNRLTGNTLIKDASEIGSKYSDEELVDIIVRNLRQKPTNMPKPLSDIITQNKGGQQSCQRQQSGQQQHQQQQHIGGSSGSKVVKKPSPSVSEYIDAARGALERGDILGYYEALSKAAENILSEIKGTLRSRMPKSAGKTPGNLERELRRLYVLGRLIERLREAIARAIGVGKKTRRVWSRMNKKLPGVRPGITLESDRPKNVWLLVDTSGSISTDQFAVELSAVARAIYDIRPKRAFLVEWDVGVQKVEQLTPSSLSKLLKKIASMEHTGGGGTVLAPALEYVKEHGEKGDVVVIVSDWFLSDPKEAERVLEELRKRKKMRIILMCTPQDCNKDVPMKMAESGAADSFIDLEKAMEKARAFEV